MYIYNTNCIYFTIYYLDRYPQEKCSRKIEDCTTAIIERIHTKSLNFVKPISYKDIYTSGSAFS